LVSLYLSLVPRYFDALPQNKADASFVRGVRTWTDIMRGITVPVHA
jgi:hypothetical protein